VEQISTRPGLHVCGCARNHSSVRRSPSSKV
jgi:hypothetical protein